MCVEALRQIPWQLESKLAAKMDRKEQTLTFYTPEVFKIKGNRKYQRPTLPTNKQSMSSQKRQQYVDQAYTYTRMFGASLSGFSLLMLICTSPLSWVQFLVSENGLELDAGLWTLCNYELCWSNIPKPPYYLQYSRAFFIISILCMLTCLGLLFNSCRPAEGVLSSELDLKVSILSFCSALCLLLCLNLFVAQVEWYTKSAMESEFLWAYYLNWCSDVLYGCAGIISFLNYITFQPHSPDESDSMVPQHKSRLQNPPTKPPTTAEKSSSKIQFLSVRGGKQSSVRAEKQPSVRAEKQPSVRAEKQPSVRGEKQPSVRGGKQPSVRGEKQPSVRGEKQPSVRGEKQPSVRL
ncbi:transmembrane protein 202 isoform X2 [Mesocricetus auratus]|uniref:Transmembrane protein 202 isoform X2 n=1 Tax=Mesocricetus auratus TaxID=10036 RepID=A0ABM2W4U8_MESAU|nr:transmembrane protein 202 isoform X2 [Mesocricetus auratus]